MKEYSSEYGTLFHADNMEVLKSLPDNSIDALVTDPPYGLSFMGKKWDYDVPGVEFWKEVLRVLKPGAHGLVACGTRTQHRMAVNLEDAGFDIRDIVMWVYGSGFPKSLNIGKAVDKIQGNERKIIRVDRHSSHSNGRAYNWANTNETGEAVVCEGSSQWEGWGTALKPAVELFTLVRKPITEKNIAENVLKWGTGGINIDECRVGNETTITQGGSKFPNLYGKYNPVEQSYHTGRFPANLIHDGSEEVTELFPENDYTSMRQFKKAGIVEDKFFKGKGIKDSVNYPDRGSAARFFYCAKASASERNEGLDGMEKKRVEHDFGSGASGGIAIKRSERVHPMMQNHHPTVKPIALMQYLIRLITPPTGVVLDPFAGSGTTGIAAVKEGKEFILIEREPEYIEIAAARVKHHINKIEPDLFTAAANA